ncbi:hypothetical protein EC844_12259 [Acinetobacter calcoaceticus]|uniref:Lipoprotein n=1 Tax=Acinetobacter calcoaceticus TaxID=471 RepID=A0A4R1XLY3_ACICA|nr:hypothetical protein EC844_12259 [Acinetobacter calcoaceticus]
MNKIFYSMLAAVFLGGCVAGDSAIRADYAKRYSQNPQYVKIYQDKINDQDVNALAVNAAKAEKSKMHGQKRFKVNDFIYVEDVKSNANSVVFEYSLTDKWFKKSKQRQLNDQQSMQKDLIYRTCSLKTVLLAQQKGLEEVHHYYKNYPDQIEFSLKSNLQLCQQHGFI